jgi:hypothetical protein
MKVESALGVGGVEGRNGLCRKPAMFFVVGTIIEALRANILVSCT